MTCYLVRVLCAGACRIRLITLLACYENRRYAILGHMWVNCTHVYAWIVINANYCNMNRRISMNRKTLRELVCWAGYATVSCMPFLNQVISLQIEHSSQCIYICRLNHPTSWRAIHYPSLSKKNSVDRLISLLAFSHEKLDWDPVLTNSLNVLAYSRPF